MDLSEEHIKQIVSQVVANVRQSIDDGDTPTASTPVSTRDEGIFDTVDAAISAAQTAHLELMEISVGKRKEIINSIREMASQHVEELSRLAVEETGFGRYEDKLNKNRLVINKTPGVEDIETWAVSGDNGLTIQECAPYGVIGSITPCTNATETAICNSIGMIAGGNSVVFNAHPTSAGASNRAVEIINSAIIEAGGPANVVTAIRKPTIQSAQQIMTHPGIRLLVVTGGPAVVRAAMKSGKRVIAAGPGNPPAVVDSHVHIEKAALDIYNGASFDNNVICTDEKVIVCVDSIASQFKEAIIAQGAVELTERDAEKVINTIFQSKSGGEHPNAGVIDKAYVGRDASYILEKSGITVKGDPRLAIIDVPHDHPLAWTEQLMPIVPLVRMPDIDKAIDYAVEVEQGNRHTASMHSLNIEKLSRMARLINSSIFIKNGPNYAGLGFGGEGYTSFTIASPTGEGLTRARHFTRTRRCTLVDYFRIT
ncbi:aldehyde dehydrogenase family protein [Candidatus Hydrogenedentota bacterium]